MEPMIRNPKFLRNWRDRKKISLRPREALANRLLCAVLRNIYNDDIVFAGDGECDGIIFNKTTNQWIKTEHVAAMNFPNVNKSQELTERILTAIQLKIDKDKEYKEKWKEYAKNKYLIVFFDGDWTRYRNRVRESIRGKHPFKMLYCIGLLSIDRNGHAYSVTEFHEHHSITFKVQINSIFTDRTIEQML